MALPTVEKTWQYNVNQTIGGTDAEECVRRTLYLWKASLIGFASNPWVVVSSSNTTNAGNTDYWSSWSDVVYNNSGKYSWIVLKQTAISSNFQILMQTRVAGSGWDFDMNFYVSPSVGFTGGTVANRPTASDEINSTFFTRGNYSWVVIWDEWLGPGYVFPSPGKFHAMMSSDGKCTRTAATIGGACPHFLVIDVPKNPISSWTNPFVIVSGMRTYNSDSDSAHYNYLNDAAGSLGVINGIPTRLYAVSDGWGSSTMGEQMTYPDDDSNEWPISPVTFATDANVLPYMGTRGSYKGTAYDLWWGSTMPVSGTTYPSDGSRQFIQIGHMIIPWNGTEMSMF